MTHYKNDGPRSPDILAPSKIEDRMVVFDEITISLDVHCRASLDRGRVKLLAEAMRTGSDIEPLTVARVGDAVVLVDGYHRHAAMRVVGSSGEINVRLLADVTTLEMARWAAFAIHWRAALPLTRKERREGFRAYVRARGHRTFRGGFKSFRGIGRELGLAHRTVGAWLKADFPSVWRAIANEEPAEADFPEYRLPTLEEIAANKTQHLASQIVATARTHPGAARVAMAALSAAMSELEAAPQTKLSDPAEYDF